uniref:Imm1 family immunity protein n=1 Tax=Saccharothrix mutabilis TaxID=33921 RepID=UPI0031D883F6
MLEVAYRHDQPTTHLRTRAEVNAFVDELLTLGPEYTAATAYAIQEGSETLPDHELLIGASSRTNVGAVRYSGEEGTWYAKGELTNPNGVVFAYFGSGQEFPPDAEVPLTVVRAALWGLLAGEGRRPEGLTWVATD